VGEHELKHDAILLVTGVAIDPPDIDKTLFDDAGSTPVHPPTRQR